MVGNRGLRPHSDDLLLLYSGPMSRSTIFLILVLAAAPLLVLGTILYRRFYRDDPNNTARRVFKNSAVPLVLRLFVRALDFVFIIVLLRLFSFADIGPYDFAILLVGAYLSTITEFGLGTLLTREVARDPSVARTQFGVTMTLRLLLVGLVAVPIAGLMIGAFTLLARLGISTELSSEGTQALWVLMLTLLPGAYSNAVTALYNAREQMEIPALIEVVTGILSVVARLTVLWMGFGIVELAWASVLVSCVTAAIYDRLQMRTFFEPKLAWNGPLMRSLLIVALPLMLNNLLNAVFFRFDVFIIRALADGNADALVGIYGVPYKVLTIAMVLPPVVTFAVFPTLARRADGDRQALAHAQNTTLGMLLLVALPLAMGMSVLARDLIGLIAGTEQALAAQALATQVLAIQAWFLPLSFVNGLLQYVLIAINRQTSITRAFAIGAVFNIVVNCLTIPLVGAYALHAAAITTILSELVLLAVFWPVLRAERLAPPLVKLAWRPLAATLAMGMAMLLVHPIGGWLMAGLVAPPTYAGVFWLVGGIGPEERALVRRVLGRAST